MSKIKLNRYINFLEIFLQDRIFWRFPKKMSGSSHLPPNHITKAPSPPQNPFSSCVFGVIFSHFFSKSLSLWSHPKTLPMTMASISRVLPTHGRVRSQWLPALTTTRSQTQSLGIYRYYTKVSLSLFFLFSWIIFVCVFSDCLNLFPVSKTGISLRVQRSKPLRSVFALDSASSRLSLVTR